MLIGIVNESTESSRDLCTCRRSEWWIEVIMKICHLKVGRSQFWFVYLSVLQELYENCSSLLTCVYLSLKRSFGIKESKKMAFSNVVLFNGNMYAWIHF